jgi:hypothetical protein
MADGGWRMADGGWRMADGERKKQQYGLFYSEFPDSCSLNDLSAFICG